MIFRALQLRCFLMMTGVLLASVTVFAQSVTVFAQDEQLPRKPRAISYPAAASTKELYVAIMGEVAKPGTYHLKSPLKLHTVLNRAGGFTADASKVIRVIREGKVSQREIYSEGVDTTLFPGDLLIVDPMRSANSSSRVQEFVAEPTTVHASYQERSENSLVQIALLNVRDYPVILKVRPQEANASKIVEKLGQPIVLLADADVIIPDRRMSSEAAKRATRLADNTVVVFKRDRVNQNRLPATLPRPIESEIAFGAQLGLIGNERGQSPELRTLGERVASSMTNPFDLRPQITGRTAQESPSLAPAEVVQSTEEQKSSFTPSVGRIHSPFATIPFKGSPRIATSSTGTTGSEPQRTNDPIPEPDDSAIDSKVTEPPVTPSLVIEDSDPTPKAALSVNHLVMILTVAGSLVLAAVLLRRVLETNQLPSVAVSMPSPIDTVPEVSQPIARGQAAQKSLLERLIKNELPIVLEPVEFPEGLTLQGRIAPRPILRVDGPQSILKQNGPHFATPEKSTNDRPLHDVIAQLDSPEKSPIPRPHFAAAGKPKVAAQAATTTDAGNRDLGQADDRSIAPLAKALFELEQGGRS